MGDRDWEAHYQAGDTPWDHGEPAPGLADFLRENPGITKGRALVPGCGFGHDAIALAHAGFTVLGMDLSPTAMTEATRRVSNTGWPVEFRHGDFLKDSADDLEPFDWMFEHTLYCAIHPSRRDEYVASTARRVRSGGHLLSVHYINPDVEEGPPFPCSREELLQRFSPHFELLSDWIPRSWEVRSGRERMFWWRRR